MGGPPFFGPTSGVPQGMAQAWREEGGRVLYLELAGDAAPYYARRARSRAEPVEAEAGTWVLRLRGLPGLPWSYPDAVRHLNLWRNHRRVRKALRAAGFAPGSFVALYYGWFWSEWVGTLGAACDVYDCIDEHRAYPHVAERPGRAAYVWSCEQRMLARAGLLVATSPVLLEDRGPLARRAVCLPNGVDLARWTPRSAEPRVEPEDLRALPPPRLVLAGHLHAKLDLEAVAGVAAAHPEWSVVLLGPVEPGTTLPPARPNLRWLGVKPHAQLGAYLAHAQVGLLPLRPTAFNRASCPLKLLEYLAAGLPVAASRIPATEEWAARFPELVQLADHAAALPQACARALDAARRLPKTEIARAVEGHTWRDRVREMAKAAQGTRADGLDSPARGISLGAS